MSRKGRKGRGRAGRDGRAPEPPDPKGRPQSADGVSPTAERVGRGARRGRLLLVAAAVAVVTGTGVVLWATGVGDGRDGSTGGPFPPPSDAHAAAPAFGDFVGAEACADCHAERYAQWAASTHGRAGGEPSAELVIAPFDGTPIRFRDARVIPRVEPDGTYVFEVLQDGHAPMLYRVDGVIGGGHMVGGGTQGFTTRTVDGTVRFLPFDWSRHAGTWFCNTGTRLDRGWLPIDETMALADCGDWFPVRVLGTVERFGNCQGCHGSQILTDQPAGQPYRSRRVSLEVNCESCHGPGRRHLELASQGRLGFDEGTGFAALGTTDKDGSLETCFRCHALKDVVREGHLPGPPLADYYALKFPILGEEPFFADFRVRTFGYQSTHLSSECYLFGSMTCVSCHDPHGQGYRDEFGGPMPGRFDDAQCTSCHAAKALDPEAHTFHPPDSDGSRCVSCHMPYLQEPEVGSAVPYARSDHTIPVPRPAFDASLGIESACAGCHDDRSPEALQAEVEARWGTLKPHRPLVAALAAEPPASGEQAAEALLRPDLNDPYAQFAALARFVTTYLEPDTDPGSLAAGRLLALAESPDLEVRALALAALHWTGAGGRTARRALTEALDGPGPEPDRVRRRWVLALSFLGDQARQRGDAARAMTAYRKALDLSPGDARLLDAMGAALNQAESFDEALAYLRRGVDADSTRALSHVNLGISLAARGDEAGAVERYAAAARANPVEPLAFFNLGNLYLRRGSLREAALAYERATELDPGLARGHYNLARTYIQLRRLGEALPRALRALELEPGNDGARQMVADLRAALGDG